MLKKHELLLVIGARVGQAKILFATEGAGGVKCYSSFSSDVRTVVNTNEDVIGLVWDSRNQQYYYSTLGKIHLKGDHTAGRFLHVPQCKLSILKLGFPPPIYGSLLLSLRFYLQMGRFGPWPWMK